MSRKFFIANGTRQGCPLSPIIFTLMMEPLAEAIRNHRDIKGIVVGEKSHKLGLFADDVVLTLTSPATSLSCVSELLDTFGGVSYYKLNVSKSSCLPIHIPSRDLKSLKTFFPFNWVKKTLPYLGITLTYPSKDTFKQNFLPICSTLSRWTWTT